MPANPEGRYPFPVRSFLPGIVLKTDLLGNPGFIRLTGFKFDKKLGALVSRGGFEDWDTGADDWRGINGLKRWYREDGGVNFFMEGDVAGTRRIGYLRLSDKVWTSLLSLAGTNLDKDEPDLWVDCGKQLIVIPGLAIGRPYSIKLNHLGSAGGLAAGKLGLDPPTVAINASAFGVSGSGTNQQSRTQIQEGTYRYGYTYSYGTYENPNEYGESAMSPISEITFLSSVAGYVGAGDYNGIIQITGWDVLTAGGLVRRINIYRSKRNATPMYKIGEILAIGLTNWNDTVGDGSIDLSLTPPTITGLPTAMRCAVWHPTLQRLFWMGVDGYFHYSDAGYPDVNPPNNKIAVGNTGYPGSGIVLIRNNIYVLKEDGIFLIQGNAPSYYSLNINSVFCKSKHTIEEMPDGVYFLGSDGDHLRVFKFDGSSAVPISGALDALIPKTKSSVVKRAYARRVGDEYQLSLMITDKRYCKWPTPFNNVIFAYNYLNKSWFDYPCQASTIEVFDGPGDSGEVFITESDPTADAAKGNLFKLKDTGGSSNISTYPLGVRAYSKSSAIAGVLSLGPFPGIGKNGEALEKVTTYELIVRARGYYSLPTGRAYADDLGMNNLLAGPVLSEASEEKANLTLTGDGASVLGIGKLGTMTTAPRLVEEFMMQMSANASTGLIADVNFSTRSSKTLEILGLDLMHSMTNNE